MLARRGLDGSWLTAGGEGLAEVVRLAGLDWHFDYGCSAANARVAWQWLGLGLVAAASAGVAGPDVLGLVPVPWPQD